MIRVPRCLVVLGSHLSAAPAAAKDSAFLRRSRSCVELLTLLKSYLDPERT